MANSYTRSPRQVAMMIELHPAEVANGVSQQAVLAGMNVEELRKINKAVTQELNVRGEQDELKQST